MNKNRLDARLKSIQSCMEVAKYLDDFPKHGVPIPKDASEADIEEIKDNYRLSRKHVAYLLNAIVFEIAIKVIWELDKNKECRFTHDICALNGELSGDSQRELKEIYEEKTSMLAELKGTDNNGRQTKLADVVKFQSLREALLANEDTMKNFKYDGVFDGKSSSMGSVIWNKDTLWTLPPLNQERLPEALYHYSMNRVRRAISGNV